MTSEMRKKLARETEIIENVADDRRIKLTRAEREKFSVRFPVGHIFGTKLNQTRCQRTARKC